jgi:hypothetical protein
MAAEDGQVLYINDAATRLGKTPKALRGDVARRLIPFRKLGGRVIFLRDELDAFLKNLPGCRLEEAQVNMAGRHR